MTRIPSLGPRGEGWVVLQLAGFGLLGLAWWLAPPAPSGDLGAALWVLAYGVGSAGAVLIGSGLGQLRRARALTAVPHPRVGASLVQGGAYRLVRHPIYGGLILGSLGLCLVAPWFGTFGAMALLAAILDLKRRREEVWLAERYAGYAAYRTRTKALIPFLY